jgi:hypothetical protein
VNEVSFRTRPHHNVHNTLGVDTRATWPSMKGGLYRRGCDRKEGGEWKDEMIEE